MAQQTPTGLTYPEPDDHTRIWEHFQQLAEDIDDTRPAKPIRVEQRDTDQAITNSTIETVVINNTILNRGAIARPGGGVLIVPTSGVYQLAATATFAASSQGNLRMAQLRVNGNMVAADRRTPLASYGTTLAVSYVALLTAGDEVRLDVFHNSGAALAVSTGGQGVTGLSVCLLSPAT